MDRPLHFAKIYLEITDCCNLRCRFCPGTTRPPRFLSPGEFGTLAEKLRPYSDYLYLHVMGEPLLHPALREILEICRQLSFRVVLTTNGSLLPERSSLLLSAEALYKVNLSLHSFEGNEGDLKDDTAFRRYLSGCIDFARAASEKGLLCILRLWNEAPGNREKQADAPADGDELPSGGKRNGEILEMLRAAFPAPWTRNTKGYRIRHRLHIEWDREFTWPDPTAPLLADRHGCQALREHIAVLSDGSVVPCCLDRNGVLTLGNLFRESLPEILASPKAEALRSGFGKGNATADLCRRCGYALRFVPAR